MLCGSSDSSVVEFGFQLDCLVCTHTRLIICIRTIGGGQGPPRVVEPMKIIITDLRRM